MGCLEGSAGVCTAPGTCPEHSTCQSSWERVFCPCNTGYVGESCVPVCQINPCANGARCIEAPESTRGYKCLCNGTEYSGNFILLLDDFYKIKKDKYFCCSFKFILIFLF